VSTITGWCRDARSGHFPKLAEQMHQTCAERLADPVQKPDECGCDCGHPQPFAGRYA
jgi:hypothetical protein